MGHTREQQLQELEGVLHAATGDLSAAQLAALVEHPEAVRSALAAAAGVLSSELGSASLREQSDVETIAGAEPERIDVREADRRMSSRSRLGGTEEVLTADELAVRIGLKTRQSVHDWRRKGRIVGWQGVKRGYVFPAGQFDRHGRLLDGLDRIVPHFSDGYSAWIWLTTRRPSLGGATPIALLGQGERDRVAAAAKGDAQGDFA
ncbi:MAG: hypothetical protein OXE53_07830 [Deltaproteobacteria bacterium]|nr:hypothetical protein [Deltaproteobacteria bacterium]